MNDVHDSDGYLDPRDQREFKSNLPDHIVAKLPDDQRHVCVTISRLENKLEFSLDVVRQEYARSSALRSRVLALETLTADYRTLTDRLAKTEHVVRKLEVWRLMVSGKAGIAVWVGTVIAPVLVKYLFDSMLKT